MALQRHTANLFHVLKFKQKRNFPSKVLKPIQKHLSYYRNLLNLTKLPEILKFKNERNWRKIMVLYFASLSILTVS